MTAVTIAERVFEDAIEAALLSGGPDALDGTNGMLSGPASSYTPRVEGLPGGYRRRTSSDYDRNLCLLPKDLLHFVMATQPREWERLRQHHGEEVKNRFLRRVVSEIEARGTLAVLRNGIKDSGVKFRLAWFRPSSGLNEDTQRLYEGNLFSIVRQFAYEQKLRDRQRPKSIDLGLFLNGIPLFTAELKNPLNGQTVRDAIRQYMTDRDPREPLLAFRRCLAHFAVDPELVSVTTQLDGPRTRFLPFNQGKFGGAGNPPVPPTGGYATRYLWDRIWARDSVLELVQRFIQEVEEEDDRGRKTGKVSLIFPRFHQLDAVRRLVQHAFVNGPGHRYLVQHSAGSGKSNTIAWLANQLSVLHDARNRRVFDSIIVITDRRILDRQLQRTVRQFEQTIGVVENIDQTSRQLRQALEGGRTIIVTTLQKFPVVVREIGSLSGSRFAVIIDEAHSSQSGESTKSLKDTLAKGSSTEEADDEEADFEDLVVEEMRKRGQLPNVSTFAFTATPKSKTLELFGNRLPDGRYQAFSLYSMRQAIEEGFILDVLQHYTTFKVFWELVKRVADDPQYEKSKAYHVVRSYVDTHEEAIGRKVAVLIEHFAQHSAHRIGGRAKAMIVCRSRLQAVRYKLAIDRYFAEHRYPYRSLVAFSGTVRDGGAEYTESSMNGASEAQTAREFEKPENRFLIVANKFQTGFDQPLLHTMYVDKQLRGVNAVQTLSRLNRTHPGKAETMILDFANEADDIREAFQPYYEKTLLSEGTDPHLLYERQQAIQKYGVVADEEIDGFARLYFDPKQTQDRLYAALRPVADRAADLPHEEREGFRGALDAYVLLYAFLAQLLTFADADLEKLYQFARFLRRLLPGEGDPLPLEIQQSIDISSYRVEGRFTGPVTLDRGQEELDPFSSRSGDPATEEREPLSEIIRSLNERFGTDFREEDKVFIRQLEERLSTSPALAASVRANSPDNARLTFEHVVTDELQEMMDTNFTFYKRVTDDPKFAQAFLGWLFDRFRKGVNG